MEGSLNTKDTEQEEVKKEEAMLKGVWKLQRQNTKTSSKERRHFVFI
jgi:hypothetical protein